MKTRHFRDLQVWQKAMQLARSTYAATETFPKSEIFGLVSQMRRAAVSVPSNIAEGQGRVSDKSFAIFLEQARGSLFELETQFELASNLGYIKREVAAASVQEREELARMINGLLSTLKRSDRGEKRSG